jgi:hypothetical protein
MKKSRKINNCAKQIANKKNGGNDKDTEASITPLILTSLFH